MQINVTDVYKCDVNVKSEMSKKKSLFGKPCIKKTFTIANYSNMNCYNLLSVVTTIAM